MNQVVVACLAGLFGGAVGGIIVGLVAVGGEGGGAFSDNATDNSELILRLNRIEDALARPTMHTTPGLRGSSGAEGAGSTASNSDVDILVARLEERLAPRLEASVEKSVAKAVAEREELTAVEAPAKKKVTLAEVAQELELTADEEEAVRRIAKETSEAFLKILAGEDASVDDVRREFEDAKGDPAKRSALGAKYMMKVMGNLGGVMTTVMTHQTKMREAIGAKRADRLENEFQVTDLDPLGLEDAFDFGD